MKRIILLLVSFLMLCALSPKANAQTSSKLVDLCSASAGDDCSYLQDFTVELQGVSASEKQVPERKTLAMQKGNTYRISVCNAAQSQGKMIVELFDAGRLMATNYNATTGQDVHKCQFTCTKTGVYMLSMHFIDNKAGSGVCVISLVN
jgi:hypothetical protein